MKILIISKKTIIIMIIIILLILVLLEIPHHLFSKKKKLETVNNDFHKVFMYSPNNNDRNYQAIKTEYFRPSNLPIINDKEFKSDFFHQFYEKEPDNITLPSYLLEEPEDTIINYFSILRQAANPVTGKGTGCGTLGYATRPYPVAYNFLYSDYKENLNYDEYLKLYENILHLNLLKLLPTPNNEKCNNGQRYFVEFETIEGSEKGVGYFAYYYGFICLTLEGDTYKISDMSFIGEDYLCAPYHFWSYIAENAVDIKYGDWCSLVQERYETQQDEYIKNIYFKGTDGNDYLIQFFQLTNGKDIEIAQYMKNKNNEWEHIKINPKDCLD